jgi:hypothetical protein
MPSQDTFKIIYVVWSWIVKCGVKSYVTIPSTKCDFNEILLTQVLRHNKNKINQQLQAFGMPQSPGFCVRPTSKRWLLKIIQVTMKHDWFNAVKESMWTLHPSCIHILCRSLKRSVRWRTWTSSIFSTNESA